MQPPKTRPDESPLESMLALCRVVASRLRLDAQDRGPSAYLPADLPDLLEASLAAVAEAEHLQPAEG